MAECACTTQASHLFTRLLEIGFSNVTDRLPPSLSLVALPPEVDSNRRQSQQREQGESKEKTRRASILRTAKRLETEAKESNTSPRAENTLWQYGSFQLSARVVDTVLSAYRERSRSPTTVAVSSRVLRSTSTSIGLRFAPCIVTPSAP